MTERRQFLTVAAAAGVLSGFPGARADDNKGKVEEVGATEDLMREHGVLNRVLLVYEEGLRRLRAKEDVPPEVFRASANLVRKFVEDYHERLEERFIFPVFEKQKKLEDLVRVLRRQHAAERELTDVVPREAAADRYPKAENRATLTTACERFIRMYRPHEAREDTVLFPALRKVLGGKEIKDLGERFEEEEHKLFGEGGFDKVVEQVAGFEKQLGIYDLDQFTPKAKQ
jgi:hemerythrin-like domain-containing protein